MKVKALPTFLLSICAASNFAAEGQLLLVNRHIATPSGDTYHVPIWVDMDGDGSFDQGEGIGSYAAAFGETATLGLYLRGENTPLATSRFRSDIYGEALGSPASQDVFVPGYAARQTAPLTIRVWVGESYDLATIRRSWDVISPPLGGTPPDGSLPIVSPTLSTWGPQDGSGYQLEAPPGPVAGTDVLMRRTISNARASITSLLANDVDAGSAVFFVGVDAKSNLGVPIVVADGEVIYAGGAAADDYFYYTVRNSSGGASRGRVNVVVNDPEGLIVFDTRNIPRADGNGTYNVPLYVDADGNGSRSQGEALGAFALNYHQQPAKLGLFLQGSDVPLAIVPFAASVFPTVPDTARVIVVPGTAPGTQANLTVKAWIGDSYEASAIKGAWDFTSRPLGGTIANGVSLALAGLTGWGPETGVGIGLAADPTPIPAIIFPIVIGQPVLIPIDASLPIAWKTNVISLPDFTEGGIVIRAWQNYAILDEALFQNDTFTFNVATPTGLTVGVGHVALQVQESPAKIFLSNRLVRRSTGPGGYNVPVWVDANFNGIRDRGEGIGSFAEKQFGTNATLGLFLRDRTAPIATARFHRDAAGSFLEDPDFQEVTIPNVSPGTTVPLTLKAWVGSSFESATIKGSWEFTSKQLGGGAHTGIFETPDVTGWGDEESGQGYAILPGSKPKTYGTVIARQAGQNVSAKVAAITKNDSDPDGRALALVSVDDASKEGGVVSVLGDTFYYVAPISDSAAPDYFEYTVRNSKGGIAKGRVDVIVTDANGQFNTRLAIEYTPSGNQISFRGIAASTYLVQFRDNVEAAWQDLGPAIHEAFGLFKISDGTPGAARFYRVLSQP